MLTWRNLLENLKKLEDKELDQTATVYIPNEEEYFPFVSWKNVPETSILDKGHYFLITTHLRRIIMTRKLSEIAAEIEKDWPKVWFSSAGPYSDAMLSLSSIEDNYGKSIVTYFLANAMTWHGEVARRIKKELKGMPVKTPMPNE